MQKPDLVHPLQVIFDVLLKHPPYSTPSKPKYGMGKAIIPVIDLFAGPGGLGEGFSSFRNRGGEHPYRLSLSIECEDSAHRTLLLRSFLRQFEDHLPPEYYCYLRGDLLEEQLYSAYQSEWERAREIAWKIRLSKETAHAVRERILALPKNRGKWILIGGPPCQAFSMAGRSRNGGKPGYRLEDDERTELYVEYLQVIADHSPAVFVMENVKGLLSASVRELSLFRQILDDLESPSEALARVGRTAHADHKHSYRLYPLAHPTTLLRDDPSDFVLRSEEHGIPQARHRVFLIGIRDDLHPLRPKPLENVALVSSRAVLTGLPRLRSSLSKKDSPESWIASLKGARQRTWLTALGANGSSELASSLRDVIDALAVPRLQSGAPFLEATISIDYRKMWYLDSKMEGITNHHARGHMASDLDRYLFAACFAKTHGRSPTLSDFPADLLPAHRNVPEALAGGHFADRFRVQLWDKPATTITSHIAKDGHYYIHPDPSQCRSLTVREAARLQTFPDNYFFCGNRTEQYSQVGNAVPPLLAVQIARRIYEMLG